jgi:hypothetical protein
MVSVSRIQAVAILEKFDYKRDKVVLLDIDFVVADHICRTDLFRSKPMLGITPPADGESPQARIYSIR